VFPGFDLAGQVGLTPLELVLIAALNSAFLVLLATALALVIGVPLGFWLAIHAPRRLVLLLKGVTNLGVAFPAFFVAFLLQVVAVEATGRVGHMVVPVYGFGLDGHLLIPVVSLALAPMALVVRMVALTATEMKMRDFVRTARAKGLSEIAVVYRHIVPNMLGSVGEAGLGALRIVLAGLVIVEYLLVWPGLGVLALRAANVQDLPIFLVSAALLALVFYVTDLGLDLVTDRRGLIVG
jgi:peptide/nickel transport system permease protein